MPSTNTTPNLGLNSWIASDKPKRTDFVSDNTIIDTVLGTHIADSTLHLTSLQKDYVTEPYKVFIHYGNGDDVNSFRPGFTPKLVLICKTSSPFIVNESGYVKVNAAVVTAQGSSGGAAVSGDSIMIYQSSAPSNGVFYNLNENNATYVLVAFK